MTHHETNGKTITFTADELEQLLSRAAEKGANKALSEVGLDGANAEEDIRDLRSLLQSLRFARKTVWQTTIRILTAGLLTALMAGLAIKLKLLGAQ